MPECFGLTFNAGDLNSFFSLVRCVACASAYMYGYERGRAGAACGV